MNLIYKGKNQKLKVRHSNSQSHVHVSINFLNLYIYNFAGVGITEFRPLKEEKKASESSVLWNSETLKLFLLWVQIFHSTTLNKLNIEMKVVIKLLKIISLRDTVFLKTLQGNLSVLSQIPIIHWMAKLSRPSTKSRQSNNFSQLFPIWLARQHLLCTQDINFI